MADLQRLPPYFPKVPKQCKPQAAAFFDCFTRESEFTPEKVGCSTRECAVRLGSGR